MQNRFQLEKTLLKKYSLIIGVDEVGRGPLAGPVVAGAVSFLESSTEGWWEEIIDSKKLSEKKREALAKQIIASAKTGIGIATVAEIETFNILGATKLAMRRAIEKLFSNSGSRSGVDEVSPYVLIDGNQTILELNFDQQSIIQGDGKVQSIAAASIIAKVARDKLMTELDVEFPQYGFAQHKGYGTIKHREAIKKFGLSAIHRPSFCTRII